MGCASDTYNYGVNPGAITNRPLVSESHNVISRGGEHPRVDRLESVVQSPRKFIRKLTRRPALDPDDEERRREEAVKLAEDYFSVNGLDDVFIDVRVYEPHEQWQRLQSNQAIHPIWKYTGGTLGWLRYSVLPFRAFHTDRYDPFTNTLNLNSDRPIEALFESGLAKEFQKNHRLGVGTYAMMQYIPFVPLYHNAKAGSDVLTFAQVHLDGENSDEVFPLTYSRIGETVVSETLSVVTLSADLPFFTSPLLRIAGRTAGRTTGMSIVKQKQLAENDNLSGDSP